MNGNNYLLDTCFILGIYNGDEHALSLMQNISLKQCSVSVITYMELLGYHGISPQDEKELTQFLSLVKCIDISQDIKHATIQLRKRHKIKLPDCIVLATALVDDLQLLTVDNGLKNKFLKETNNF